MTHTYPKFIQILPPLSPTTPLLSWVPVMLCQLVLVANYTAITPIFTHLSCNYMNITEPIIELCSLHNGVF